jgi:hypothetical protein
VKCNGGRRCNTVAVSCPAFRFVRSGELVILKESTLRIPPQRTVGPTRTVPRVLGTRRLSMFTSGISLGGEQVSVDKVQPAFEMQENTLELFSGRVLQNWLSPASAPSRKEKLTC